MPAALAFFFLLLDVNHKLWFCLFLIQGRVWLAVSTTLARHGEGNGNWNGNRDGHKERKWKEKGGGREEGMGREERGRKLGRRGEEGTRCQSGGRRKLCNVHLVCRRRSRRPLH